MKARHGNRQGVIHEKCILECCGCSPFASGDLGLEAQHSSSPGRKNRELSRPARNHDQLQTLVPAPKILVLRCQVSASPSRLVAGGALRQGPQARRPALRFRPGRQRSATPTSISGSRPKPWPRRRYWARARVRNATGGITSACGATAGSIWSTSRTAPGTASSARTSASTRMKRARPASSPTTPWAPATTPCRRWLSASRRPRGRRRRRAARFSPGNRTLATPPLR